MNRKKIMIIILIFMCMLELGWEVGQAIVYQYSLPNSEESELLESNMQMHISDVQNQFKELQAEIAQDYLSQNYQEYQELFETDKLQVENKSMFSNLSDIEWEEKKEKLLRIPSAYLTESQKDCYQQILRFLNIELVRTKLPDYENVLAPTHGNINQINELLLNYHLKNELDLQNYLDMLSLLSDSVKQMCKRIQLQISQGNRPTHYCIIIALQQCEKLEKNRFYQKEWEDIVEEMNDLSIAEKNEYKVKRNEIIENELMPIWLYLQWFLQWIDKDETEIGLSQKTSGLEYYQIILKRQTGTEYDVEAMIVRLEEKQTYLLKKVQLLLAEDPSLAEWYASGNDLTDNFDSAMDMVEWLKKKTEQNYPIIKQNLYQIIYHDSDTLMPNIMAYYTQAPLDTDFVDTITINQLYAKPSMQLYLILAHESYPGHMYLENYKLTQVGEQNNIIEYILPLSGYKEGWATYASLNALDWLNEDENKITLYRDLYLLNETLMCLVDLYVNGKGWSQQQIARYYEKYYGSPMSQEELEELYQFCIAEPGLYLPYIIGYFEWIDMEQMWKNQIQNSEVSFEETVLAFGKLPYEMLRKKLQNSINIILGGE